MFQVIVLGSGVIGQRTIGQLATGQLAIGQRAIGQSGQLVYGQLVNSRLVNWKIFFKNSKIFTVLAIPELLQYYPPKNITFFAEVSWQPQK